MLSPTLITLCIRQNDTDEQDIVRAIINKKGYLLTSADSYPSESSVNIKELFSNSIEVLFDSTFQIENYLSTKEINELTSESQLNDFRSQQGASFNWKQKYGESLNIKFIEPKKSYQVDFDLIYSVSKPLISKDSQFSLVFVFQSHGPETGSSDILLLKKVYGKWKIIASFNQSVS